MSKSNVFFCTILTFFLFAVQFVQLSNRAYFCEEKKKENVAQIIMSGTKDFFPYFSLLDSKIN